MGLRWAPPLYQRLCADVQSRNGGCWSLSSTWRQTETTLEITYRDEDGAGGTVAPGPRTTLAPVQL